METNEDREEMDVGELRLKKIKSTAPQRGTNASAGRVKTMTPDEYRIVLEKEVLARGAARSKTKIKK